MKLFREKTKIRGNQRMKKIECKFETLAYIDGNQLKCNQEDVRMSRKSKRNEFRGLINPRKLEKINKISAFLTANQLRYADDIETEGEFIIKNECSVMEKTGLKLFHSCRIADEEFSGGVIGGVVWK